MNLRPRSLLVAVVCIAAVAGALSPAAVAAPIDEKRAEAAQLQSEIDSNGRKIDALSEEANGAQFRLDQAAGARDEAQLRIDAARQEATRLRALLRDRAVNVYRGGGQTSPLDAINVDDAREYATRTKYASAAAASQNKLVDQLRDAQDELAVRKAEQERLVQQAQAERARIAETRSAIEAANATQRQLLGRVTGELAVLVQEEEQRKQAEAAARARALTTPRPAAGSSGGNWSGPLPAASGGAGAAVAFARAQLGKPYVYAAAGPDTYDCSGLTMRAWQAGGVSMPHYSGAQFDMFPQVPLSALQPGDLVYWGPGGANHVAIYSGGGMVISAPRTGDFVKEIAIYGSPSGANRPG